MKDSIPVYELSLSLRVTWQAHSMSNSGNNGTNRLYPRRQLLNDGTETDACSGNIFKHYHARLLMEKLFELKCHLCPACLIGDSRRAEALDEALTMAEYLRCGICDTHGFLIPEKKEGGQVVRKGVSKHSLIEFSMALALPDQHTDSPQIYTRQSIDSESGGQMIFKQSSRSGAYGLCIRYKAAGLGVDTNTRKPIIKDENLRLGRHKAILESLKEQLLSPSGALTSISLPHLTGIEGIIIIKTQAGRAPILSPLIPDFIVQSQQLADTTRVVFAFNSLGVFDQTMTELCEHSYPIYPFH
ncbi:MAG TPA: hypothetical protein P5280_00815 [Cyclobacteriaceae bacterium]|nr:hypothetical protein [Cyclobacteriaceae bacterium]